MSHHEISNSDDIIDSRDVIARIEELEEIAQEPEWALEDNDELSALKALAGEASQYAEDWEYGATLIRDSYFESYALELAEDIGAIDPNATWPNNCIDWERAARELRMDYSAVSFAGVTYWVR
jgi:antirestriction protein